MSDHILKNYILTNDGKWVDIGDRQPPEDEDYQLHWIHLYRESIATQRWLYDQQLDELVIDSLTDEDTRPRTTVFPEGILLNMRTVNTSEEYNPYDMLSMRLFIQPNRIISTSLKEIHIIKDITEIIDSNRPPQNKGDLISYMIELITDRIEPYIVAKNDWVYDYECHMIDHSAPPKSGSISEIRRAAVTFARYLSPQIDALMKLLGVKTNLFCEDDRIVVTESINVTKRYIEELDSINNRCHILKDDLNTAASEKMNKNMYLLSVMTAVFLPLSFLTGLLGVNLGGIPGAESSNGFYAFSSVLIAILVTQVILLWISKRF